MVTTGVPGVFPWSDVEDEGLILSPCALDVEDYLKATDEHPGFALRAAREAIQNTSHNLPSMSSCKYCWRDRLSAAISGRRATGKRKPASRAGWRNVDKHTIGDSLRAGVTKHDLSEKALGAVCFGGFKCSRETDPGSLSRLPSVIGKMAGTK
jgi:hypothetical protein